jgi:hypothetical protein
MGYEMITETYLFLYELVEEYHLHSASLHSARCAKYYPEPFTIDVERSELRSNERSDI